MSPIKLISNRTAGALAVLLAGFWAGARCAAAVADERLELGEIWLFAAASAFWAERGPMAAREAAA